MTFGSPLYHDTLNDLKPKSNVYDMAYILLELIFIICKVGHILKLVDLMSQVLKH